MFTIAAKMAAFARPCQSIITLHTSESVPCDFTAVVQVLPTFPILNLDADIITCIVAERANDHFMDLLQKNNNQHRHYDLHCCRKSE